MEKINCPFCKDDARLNVDKKQLSAVGDNEIETPVFIYECESCNERFTTTESDTFSVALYHYNVRQLLEPMLPHQEEDYTDHFLEWRTKYFEKKPLLLSWKSGSGHFTTKQLEARYEKAFLQSPTNLPPTK